MIILMGFHVQVRAREGEGSAVNHYILQNIGVLALSRDSGLRKSGHAIDSTQAIRVDSDMARQRFVDVIDCQQDEVDGHQTKQFTAICIGCRGTFCK